MHRIMGKCISNARGTSNLTYMNETCFLTRQGKNNAKNPAFINEKDMHQTRVHFGKKTEAPFLLSVSAVRHAVTQTRLKSLFYMFFLFFFSFL